MSELSNQEIIGRVQFSSSWLKNFRNSDLTASASYIDANGVSGWWEDNWDDETGDQTFNPVADVPDVVPVGQPNYMAINTEVSSAAVSSQTPKLHVRANEGEDGYPGAPAIVQQAWQQVWTNGNFKKEMRAAYQKRKICGLGCIWYRWDEIYGFVIENVTSNRFFFDPHATNLRRLRYAGVAINLPLSEAMRRYDPDGEHEYFSADQPSVYTGKQQGALRKAYNRVKSALSMRGQENAPEAASTERSTCKIYIYFDRQEEVHIYQDQVLMRTPNLYGAIPLFFRSMFIDPRDRILPLGMNVFARGLNEWLVWLVSIAANTAKNGGPITLFDSSRVKGQARIALEQGSSSQMIGLEGMINPQTNPIIRVPAEQLSPAFATSRMEVQSAMDGIMGASPGMRGESSPGVTATSAMLTEAKSNAIMVDEQNEFEDWVTDVATAFVACTQKFGGPKKDEEVPSEAKLLWHAFQAVNSVMVVHGSTSFSNPAMEVQASMQLFTTALQSQEYWTAAAASGVMKKVPKLETIFNDMLIALNRTNIDEYWMDAPPPPQGPSTIPVDVVDWMTKNYPLSPPDIQRQIEQMLGMQPSQTGTPPEPEQQDNSLQVTAMQHQMEMQKLVAKAQEQQSSHVQEMRMQALKTQSDIALENHKAALAPKEPDGKGKSNGSKS